MSIHNYSWMKLGINLSFHIYVCLCDLYKRPGEISQFVMFNPNLKKKNSTWTLNIKIWVICLYNLCNTLKVHVVWLFYYKFGLNIMISPGLFIILINQPSILMPRLLTMKSQQKWRENLFCHFTVKCFVFYLLHNKRRREISIIFLYPDI